MTGREAERDCPACQGEGTVLVAKQGGWFSQNDECWYPSHVEIQCLKCHGSGLDHSDDPVKVFNATPEYALLKKERRHQRWARNEVIASILGLTPKQLADESEEAA